MTNSINQSQEPRERGENQETSNQMPEERAEEFLVTFSNPRLSSLSLKNPNAHFEHHIMWRAGLQGRLLSVFCIIQLAITIWNCPRKKPNSETKPWWNLAVINLKYSKWVIQPMHDERHYITSVPARSQAMASFWAAAKWPTRLK